MLDKYIFNEDIKRVFNIITNGEILSHYILKDYISDIEIINEFQKKEKMENNNNPNSISRNTGNFIDSSQNLIALNNIMSKTNTSIHPITAFNNSFLFLNSSLRSLCLDNLEGLIIECKWKNKYILLLKIIKLDDKKKFYKSIVIECIELNHYENPFSIEFSLYWNSTELQTLMLIKVISKNEIIEDMLNRELNTNDKNKIFNKISSYLFKDLANIENILTSLIFANMEEISLYLNDIKNLIKSSPGTSDKRLEFYNSPLLNTVQNCRVYDTKTNLLCQEFILSGYYAEKKRQYQIRWEKKVNNEPYCLTIISIIYLEENITLIIFKNIYQTHITSQMLYEVNQTKKVFFDNIKEYFLKKNKELMGNYISNSIKGLDIKIGIKNCRTKEDNEQFDLNMLILNNSFIKKRKTTDEEIENKEQEIQFDSIFQNISNISIKEEDSLFNDTI